MDRDGSGQIKVDDIAAIYNVAEHKDYISGKATKEQILN